MNNKKCSCLFNPRGMENRSHSHVFHCICPVLHQDHGEMAYQLTEKQDKNLKVWKGGEKIMNEREGGCKREIVFSLEFSWRGT